MMSMGKTLAAFAVTGLFASVAQASPLNYWSQNGFTQIADKDGVYIQEAHTSNPANVDQPDAFDAQYLYYKREGSILKIGLQTKLNLREGSIYSNPVGGNAGTYFAGDLALAFDKTKSSTNQALSNYDKAVHLGLSQGQYRRVNDKSTMKEEGLYQVENWYAGKQRRPFDSPAYSFRTDRYYDSGNKKIEGGLLSNELVESGGTFARIVSIDLNKVKDENGGRIGGSALKLHAYWTMSCGNDNVWGDVDIPAVPVPAAFWLFGSGLLGLAGLRKKAKA